MKDRIPTIVFGFLLFFALMFVVNSMRDSAEVLNSETKIAFKPSRIYDGSLGANHQRVRILARETAQDGVQTLTVMLKSQVEIPMKVKQERAVADDVRIICVGIFGDPAVETAKAGLAEQSKCPLPVSKTIVRSGTTSEAPQSSLKQRRTLPTIGGSSGANDSKVPGNKIKFGNN